MNSRTTIVSCLHMLHYKFLHQMDVLIQSSVEYELATRSVAKTTRRVDFSDLLRLQSEVYGVWVSPTGEAVVYEKVPLTGYPLYTYVPFGRLVGTTKFEVIRSSEYRALYLALNSELNTEI